MTVARSADDCGQQAIAANDRQLPLDHNITIVVELIGGSSAPLAKSPADRIVQLPNLE